MKLLLTSGGLKNPLLVDALVDMVGLSIGEIKIAFIPTASNMNVAGKAYALQQRLNLRRLGACQVTTVDISKLSRKEWLPLLEESHVIYVNGGNTTRLMRWVTKSGLQDELAGLLSSRVYVGVSAGSYIATPDTRLNSDTTPEILPALHFVDFGIQAHYRSTSFKLAKTLELVKGRIKDCPYPVYALDDHSAVKVIDESVEVVGEGEWLLLGNSNDDKQ